MGNITKAIFCKARVCRTEPLFQYDYGQILQFVVPYTLSTTYEVHFSNQAHGTAKTQIGNADGVAIPDEYLETGETIYAWLFLHTGPNDGETELTAIIPVIGKSKTTNTPIKPVQQDVITETIAALNSGVERAEAAADEAEKAVSDVQETVDTALQEAKESGEFDGPPGDPGVSPTVTVTDIEGGHRITITDATGPHSFDVMNGEDGQGAVTDVQVNGTSVVTDGVANVPIANDTTPGVAKTVQTNGIYTDSNKVLTLSPVTDLALKLGNNTKYAVNTAAQHKATFYGLAKAAGDTTQSQSSNAVGNYTESAKSAISQMLNGSVSITGTTPVITAMPGIQYVCGEVSTLDITLPASGCIDVVFESGSTATVLTVTPTTGVTLKWANGFDPTSLEANTTYEINIADGLGVAGQWS